MPGLSRVRIGADVGGTFTDVVLQSASSEVRVLEVLSTPPGDVLHHRMPAGGGWGDPLEREPEDVAADVLDDKIPRGAAREQYAVVVDESGAVDREATDELRASPAGKAREGVPR